MLNSTEREAECQDNVGLLCMLRCMGSPVRVLPVQVQSDGKVLQALYDPDGSHVQRISAVTEVGDRLYFGNLAGDYVSFVKKP